VTQVNELNSSNKEIITKEKEKKQMKVITNIVYAAVVAFALACFGPSTDAAGLNPPPDGGYPGGNTAEGRSALFSLTSGGYNTAVGFFSLRGDTTGGFNTGVGAGALLANTADENTATGAGALLSNTTGGFNTAHGAFALFSNTTGIQNTANGAFALRSNTTGAQNTANGVSALFNNSTGSRNTADGTSALYSNTTASGNTATGWQALFSNTTGDNNAANGYQALFSNTDGTSNTATGSQALLSNTTGGGNTATGFQALLSNTTSLHNTAIGYRALSSNTDSDNNTAIGSGALINNTGANNTAVGSLALGANTTGSNNIALGDFAGGHLTIGDYNIDIGNSGVAGDNSTIRIGNDVGQIRTFIGGIRGVATGNDDAIPVVIDSFGQLGTTSSSCRFKTEIKPMDKASEAILALKPVTFHYKSNVGGRPQFGLIAEEVANVNPNLVVRDKNGEIYTVRYDAVNAMLLNEFLKEHRKVQQLESNVGRQEAIISQLKQEFEFKLAEQQKQIRALNAGLEKVSTQLEASKAAPRMVDNDQ
jgi:hypothetical protein